MSNEKYMCRGDSSWPWATWQGAKYTALLHKGTAAPDCTRGTCNPANFTVLKPSDWTRGHIIGMRIDGKALDSGL
jgi:hypothetical protein